ncbi:MAG: 4Fe-4S binding protein [Candidatus Micrarchaeota archaeon]
MVIKIDKTKCMYCGACVGVCPYFALRLKETYVEIGDCKSCGTCVRACPMNAITLEK